MLIPWKGCPKESLPHWNVFPMESLLLGIVEFGMFIHRNYSPLEGLTQGIIVQGNIVLLEGTLANLRRICQTNFKHYF